MAESLSKLKIDYGENTDNYYSLDNYYANIKICSKDGIILNSNHYDGTYKELILKIQENGENIIFKSKGWYGNYNAWMKIYEISIVDK